jgi:hypothetical protein
VNLCAASSNCQSATGLMDAAQRSGQQRTERGQSTQSAHIPILRVQPLPFAGPPLRSSDRDTEVAGTFFDRLFFCVFCFCFFGQKRGLQCSAREGGEWMERDHTSGRWAC